MIELQEVYGDSGARVGGRDWKEAMMHKDLGDTITPTGLDINGN